MIYPSTYIYSNEEICSFVISPFHLSTKFENEYYQLNPTQVFSEVEEINYHYNSQNIGRYEIWLPNVNGGIMKYELKYHDLFTFYPLYLDLMSTMQSLDGFWVPEEYEFTYNLRNFISEQISDEYIFYYANVLRIYCQNFYDELGKIGYERITIDPLLFQEEDLIYLEDISMFFENFEDLNSQDLNSQDLKNLRLLPAA